MYMYKLINTSPFKSSKLNWLHSTRYGWVTLVLVQYSPITSPMYMYVYITVHSHYNVCYNTTYSTTVVHCCVYRMSRGG